MPRVSKKALLDRTISGLSLKRTVGIEVEGYMQANPRHTLIRHASIKRDYSLTNAEWYAGRNAGVELVTGRMSDFNVLDEMFTDMAKAGWSARGTKPGMHIHIDVSDFSLKDKVRAAYFGKSIEDVMYLLVKNYRFHNGYCHSLPHQWLGIFNRVAHDDEAWNRMEHVGHLQTHIRNKTGQYPFIDTGKYNWLNIFSTRYPTIEFRIFHTISKAQDAKIFAYLAHQFIETVKNSTLEQLQFIADSIHNEHNVELKVEKLLVALGVPYEVKIISRSALTHLQQKIRAAQRVAVSV